jgi:hypothetical protein
MVCKKVYGNLGMLCMACYLMFTHGVCWKYQNKKYMFNFHDRGPCSSLFCPGAYNAAMTFLHWLGSQQSRSRHRLITCWERPPQIGIKDINNNKMKFFPRNAQRALIWISTFLFIFNINMMQEGSQVNPIWGLVSNIIIDTLITNMDTSIHHMIGFRKSVV